MRALEGFGTFSCSFWASTSLTATARKMAALVKRDFQIIISPVQLLPPPRNQFHAAQHRSINPSTTTARRSCHGCKSPQRPGWSLTSGVRTAEVSRHRNLFTNPRCWRCQPVLWATHLTKTGLLSNHFGVCWNPDDWPRPHRPLGQSKVSTTVKG